MLKLGIDIIKIDKMFLDAIGTERNSTTIVETLVDARNMHMDVVPEGVENFEQVMHLCTLGVRSAQDMCSLFRFREARSSGSSSQSVRCTLPRSSRSRRMQLSGLSAVSA